MHCIAYMYQVWAPRPKTGSRQRPRPRPELPRRLPNCPRRSRPRRLTLRVSVGNRWPRRDLFLVETIETGWLIYAWYMHFTTVSQKRILYDYAMKKQVNNGTILDFKNSQKNMFLFKCTCSAICFTQIPYVSLYNLKTGRYKHRR